MPLSPENQALIRSLGIEALHERPPVVLESEHLAALIDAARQEGRSQAVAEMLPLPVADAPAPTLRDQFAMGALPCLSSSSASAADRIAKAAYEIADAMMKAREQ